MRRTQVYLSEQELLLLERAANRFGASRSELIRRAIRARCLEPDLDARRAATRDSAGTWESREFTGVSCVDAVREDLNDPLGHTGSA